MSTELTPEEQAIEHGWVNPWWTHVRIKTDSNDKGYHQHPREHVFIFNNRVYIKDPNSMVCYFADLRRCRFMQIVPWSDDWKFEELP